MKSLYESAQQTAYQEFFKKKLEEYGVNSPAELSKEDKSKFFSEIKKEWPNAKVNESLNESLAKEYNLKKEGYPLTYKQMQEEEIYDKPEADYIKAKLGDKVILVSEEDRVWGPIDDTLRNQEFKLKGTKSFGGRDGLQFYYGIAKGEPMIYGVSPDGIEFALFQNK